MLFETENEVLVLLDKVVPTKKPDTTIEQVEARIDSAAEMFKKAYPERSWIYGTYELLIPWALRELGDFDFLSFAKLLKTKHDRYGDAGLIKWGHAGMVMRIGSKLDRFANLTKNPQMDTDATESRWDTLADIVGYSILGIMMLEQGH